mgnify:CR=1 FL=1
MLRDEFLGYNNNDHVNIIKSRKEREEWLESVTCVKNPKIMNEPQK